MLVRVRAAEREEHASPGEPALLEQELREARPRLGAPRGRHEAQRRGLFLDRAHDPRMLVPEVHALREAAHVEESPTLVVDEVRTLAADDRRRAPIRLDAPTVHHRAALDLGGCLGGQGEDTRWLYD